MGRWTLPVAFAVVGVGLILGGHYYMWARLIRDVGLSTPSRQALPWVLGGIAVSIPLAVVASRFVRPEWSVWWVGPAYFWIGASFLLVMAVAATDVLRVGYSLAAFGLAGPDADGRQMLARLGACLAVAIGMGASAWAVREGRKVRVKRVEVPLRKLPKALDGLRIVQLSDVHVGPTIGRAFLQHVVATVNALSPDIVAITGDLVDGSVEDIKHRVAPLADLTSTYGTYFVTGNHEYHAGAPEWCEHLGDLGIRVLRNEYVEVERDGHILHLAGIDDYEAANFDVGHGADLEKAVAGRDPSRALILLAHQPKAIHEAVRYGVDLQLSGHTHGGQLWPLWLLQRVGQPVVAGLAKFGESFVYVSCGTGSSGPPMRLAAPAEITDIVLRSA
jgi:uncharacterized protein